MTTPTPQPCVPAADAEDGSLQWLQTPKGAARVMQLRIVDGKRHWASTDFYVSVDRMAAGWTYLGPATPPGEGEAERLRAALLLAAERLETCALAFERRFPTPSYGQKSAGLLRDWGVEAKTAALAQVEGRKP